MSGISRRSLLGYSGTAAAGAALGSAGSAQAAEGEAAEASQAAAQASASGSAAQSTTTFPPNTQFKGRTSLPSFEGELTITFSVAMVDAPSQHSVPPIEIANALNELAQQRGWNPITFYGTPAPVPLTS
ncbi:hypothetical protein LG634_16630 [Streptomyces bambusae]|uniref:hypothetical protein n=1 Tax=Streptomyces bambusae TaxID=1550616 RepID=UPI001CFD8379|nr:hypothetical protein [Streptomyces bambusae]MCB5166458.1 hypothetical protein [Streptomyces bambusae]